MTVHGWLRYSLARRMLPPSVESVLEIGAGVGAAAELLRRDFEYVGLEPDPESFALASSRLPAGASLLNVREENYEGPGFDAVLAFEVLEHIEDDLSALRRWQRHVNPGGVLMVSVPAGKGLTPTDVRQGHFRRYTRDGLAERMLKAGLRDVRVVGYGFPVGHALRLVSDVFAQARPTAEDRTGASGRWMQPSGGLAIIHRSVAAPFTVAQRAFPNRGSGLIALGYVRESAPSGRTPQCRHQARSGESRTR